MYKVISTPVRRRREGMLETLHISLRLGDSSSKKDEHCLLEMFTPNTSVNADQNLSAGLNTDLCRRSGRPRVSSCDVMPKGRILGHSWSCQPRRALKQMPSLLCRDSRRSLGRSLIVKSQIEAVAMLHVELEITVNLTCFMSCQMPSSTSRRSHQLQLRNSAHPCQNGIQGIGRESRRPRTSRPCALCCTHS